MCEPTLSFWTTFLKSVKILKGAYKLRKGVNILSLDFEMAPRRKDPDKTKVKCKFLKIFMHLFIVVTIHFHNEML